MQYPVRMSSLPTLLRHPLSPFSRHLLVFSAHGGSTWTTAFDAPCRRCLSVWFFSNIILILLILLCFSLCLPFFFFSLVIPPLHLSTNATPVRTYTPPPLFPTPPNIDAELFVRPLCRPSRFYFFLTVFHFVSFYIVRSSPSPVRRSLYYQPCGEHLRLLLLRNNTSSPSAYIPRLHIFLLTRPSSLSPPSAFSSSSTRTLYIVHSLANLPSPNFVLVKTVYFALAVRLSLISDHNPYSRYLLDNKQQIIHVLHSISKRDYR